MDLDRLSALPDNILSLILSKLPIRDAIRCSVLSKTWRFLYRGLPDLIFTPYHLIPPRHLPPTVEDLSWSTIENRISHILRMHSSDLETFDLSIGIADRWVPDFFRTPRWFTHESLSEWLRCVATKNVKRLFLKYSSEWETPPPSLFSCTTLTLLTLNTCILTTFPTDFAGFKHLTDCTLIHTQMTDDSLAVFLSHCPLLHKFNLRHCAGLQTPVISSLNLTDLVLTDWHCAALQLNSPQQLTVKCPKLTTLKTNMCIKDLRVNGMEFYEISSTIKSLRMKTGNNSMELSLHSSDTRQYNFSVNRFLELVGTLRSMKMLTINVGNSYFGQENGIVVPLFNLLSRLPNLERLHLRGRLILEETEGEVDPLVQCLTYPLVNLQIVEIDVHKYDVKELGLLGCILQIAPALKEVTLRPAPGGERDNRQSFFESWESLKRSREQGTVMPEKICEISFVF
eukprot:PITA_30170